MSTNPETCAPFSHAFDREANDYFARWDAHPLVRLFRARIVATVVHSTAPPARVLDLGCGPGTDARLLGALGYTVVGVDASAEMVRQATQSGVDARRGDIAGDDDFGTFDIVFSNFGALNCVPMARAAQTIRRALRPGGVLVAVTISSACLAERVALAARGRWPRGRGSVAVVQGVALPQHHPTPETWSSELGPGFVCEVVEALGALMAPPALGGSVGLAASIEGKIAAWPGVRALGDHTLVVFRRAE